MSSFILGPQRLGEISLVVLDLQAAAMHSVAALTLGVPTRELGNLAAFPQDGDDLNVSIRVAVSKVGCGVYSSPHRECKGRFSFQIKRKQRLASPSLVPFAAESLPGLAPFPRVERMPAQPVAVLHTADLHSLQAEPWGAGRRRGQSFQFLWERTSSWWGWSIQDGSVSESDDFLDTRTTHNSRWPKLKNMRCIVVIGCVSSFKVYTLLTL